MTGYTGYNNFSYTPMPKKELFVTLTSGDSYTVAVPYGKDPQETVLSIRNHGIRCDKRHYGPETIERIQVRDVAETPLPPPPVHQTFSTYKPPV